MTYEKPFSDSDQTRQTVIQELVSDLSADPRMAPVIETFMAELPVLMDRIDAAAKQKDIPGIRVAAHKLKGAAGSAGFARLFDLAAQVEDLAEQGRLETALPLIADLIRICRLATPTAASATKP
jgi:HPt (histidine-containing phosphotransfer) domain-containing protein